VDHRTYAAFPLE
jgi:hypothetical protein